MSVTFSEAESGAGAWLTVGEVAVSCHVSERTVRRWVSEGVVRSRVSREGLRESRLILRESLPAMSPANTPFHAMPGSPDTPCQAMAGGDIKPPGSSAASHALSDIATVTRRAERAEDRLELVLSERDRQAEEIEHLRAQLEVRARELERRDQAERELRAVLVHLEATNAALAGALVPKALPPAEPLRRARWWAPWSRR